MKKNLSLLISGVIIFFAGVGVSQIMLRSHHSKMEKLNQPQRCECTCQVVSAPESGHKNCGPNAKSPRPHGCNCGQADAEGRACPCRHRQQPIQPNPIMPPQAPEMQPDAQHHQEVAPQDMDLPSLLPTPEAVEPQTQPEAPVMPVASAPDMPNP